MAYIGGHVWIYGVYKQGRDYRGNKNMVSHRYTWVQ